MDSSALAFDEQAAGEQRFDTVGDFAVVVAGERGDGLARGFEGLEFFADDFGGRVFGLTEDGFLLDAELGLLLGDGG